MCNYIGLATDLSYADRINKIRTLIPNPALYEQLAEECAELSQACLKKARKIRGENYTPKTEREIDNELIEEISDVILCIEIIPLYGDNEIINRKLNRWIERNEPKNEESSAKV